MVNLSYIFADGRRQILAFGFPGDLLFGRDLPAPAGYTAEARDPVELCQLDAALFCADGGDTLGLIDAVAQEIDRRNRHALLLGRMCADERVASFLLEHSERVGSDRLKLLLSRAEIADYLCLTKETLSRCLKRLRSDSLIEMAGPDTVDILDRDGLVAASIGAEPTGRR